MAIVALEALTFGLNRLAQAAKKHNEPLYLLTGNKDIYRYELDHDTSNLIKVIEIDTFNKDEVRQTLKNIDNLKAILNLTDTWSMMAIELSQEFNLPHQDINAVKISRNKHQMRDHLYQHGLSKSQCMVIDITNPMIDDLTICYPAIIKDASGTGSMNVWIAYHHNDLQNIMSLAPQAKLKSTYLTVEPFFHGALYSAETITWNNQTKVYAITNRIMSGEPYFKEEAMSTPATIDQQLEKQIKTHITKSLSTIGYTEGMAHIEFVMTNTGIEIIEINPRVGGGQITESLCQAFDYNILESYIEIALNKKPTLLDKALTPSTYVGTALVYANQTGVFDKVNGLERFAYHQSKPVFYPTAQTGKPITSLSDQTSCVGIVMAYGDNSEQALLNVLAAKNNLTIQVK